MQCWWGTDVLKYTDTLKKSYDVQMCHLWLSWCNLKRNDNMVAGHNIGFLIRWKHSMQCHVTLFFWDMNIALIWTAVLYCCHDGICLFVSYTMKILTSRINMSCSQDLKEYSNQLYHTHCNDCLYTFPEEA